MCNNFTKLNVGVFGCTNKNSVKMNGKRLQHVFGAD